MRAVSDAGPLHYLVLVGHVGLLGQLFDGGVCVPQTVRDELGHPRTPASVRIWTAAPPPWLSVVPSPPADPGTWPAALDRGERDVLALAARLRPGLVLMDDRAGVATVRARGFAVTGTLGLLYRAAERGLIDLPGAFVRLRSTNFHHAEGLLDGLLARFEAGVAMGTRS